MRRTGEPYIEHPIAVAGILAELGMDDTTLAAGLLHDVVEDCGVTFNDLATRFGIEVAQLVDGVTKLKHIDFTSKQEKQAENLRKLFLAMAGDVRVIIIKLCDRLHNMRTLDPFPEERRREIAAETLHILAPIAHRLGIWRIKWELEDRSFKYLEPDIYKQIYAKVQKTRTERARHVEPKPSIFCNSAVEEAQHIEAEVTGRPKHFYSIYQKTGEGNRGASSMNCTTSSRCSRLCRDKGERLLLTLWAWCMASGSRFPRCFSITSPKAKANKLPEIFAGCFGPSSDPSKCRFRSPAKMHREAEFGIAAHWRYKEEDAPDQNFGDKLRWLRFVLELQSDTNDDAQDYLRSSQNPTTGQRPDFRLHTARRRYLPAPGRHTHRLCLPGSFRHRRFVRRRQGQRPPGAARLQVAQRRYL